MKKKCILTVFLTIFSLFLSFTGQAADGKEGSEGKGGGPDSIRAVELKAFIENELKHAVRKRWAALVTYSGPEASVVEMISKMKNSFHQDLESRYEIHEQCWATDKVGAIISRPASANMASFKGPICFDVNWLARLNTSRDELIALAIHEHAHHFNIVDDKHELARVAKDAKDLQEAGVHVARAALATPAPILTVEGGPDLRERERQLPLFGGKNYRLLHRYISNSNETIFYNQEAAAAAGLLVQSPGFTPGAKVQGYYEAMALECRHYDMYGGYAAIEANGELNTGASDSGVSYQSLVRASFGFCNVFLGGFLAIEANRFAEFSELFFKLGWSTPIPIIFGNDHYLLVRPEIGISANQRPQDVTSNKNPSYALSTRSQKIDAYGDSIPNNSMSEYYVGLSTVFRAASFIMKVKGDFKNQVNSGSGAVGEAKRINLQAEVVIPLKVLFANDALTLSARWIQYYVKARKVFEPDDQLPHGSMKSEAGHGEAGITYGVSF